MKKILIVDDDPAILQAVKLALIDEYVVYLERIAEECMQFLEKRAIDLIITDYNLGHSNGLDLAKSIIACDPKINIILISGNMDESLEKQAFASGIKACFSKPFVLKELLNTIKDLLEESNLRCA